MKRFTSLAVLLILAIVVSACGGKSNNSPSASSSAASNGDSGKAVKITILNSKSEIQTQLADAGKEFSKANPNITVEVVTTAQNQSPVEKASALYASGTPATLTMLDAGDIAKFADKALDLSGEKWVADMAQPNQIDGKTLAFPFSIEGYGLIYNKAVLNKVFGGSFDPSTINTTAKLEDLFKKIQAAGTAPIVVGSMDWSLGNHFLPISYATQPGGDVAKFIDSLKKGETKLADNTQFNGLLDTFDVMKKYNMGKNDPLAVTHESAAAAVAKGQAAITFNGTWTLPEIQKTDPSGEYGFIPVPISNNADDKANSSVASGATKQIFIDKSMSTPEQQDAAKKFLNWLVYDQAGQDFLVNKASVIPAFKNITLQPTNSLAKALIEYNNAGKSIPFGGNYVPGDHWSVLGASMQKYLVDKIDRKELASEVEDYWKGVK